MRVRSTEVDQSMLEMQESILSRTRRTEESRERTRRMIENFFATVLTVKNRKDKAFLHFCATKEGAD